MVLKDGKPCLTVIGPNNTLSYRPIEIASNDGKILRILSGVEDGALMALNVGDTVPEGGKVRPIEEKSELGRK